MDAEPDIEPDRQDAYVEEYRTKLQALLDTNGDVNTRSLNDSPLGTAVAFGLADFIPVLVAAGANVNGYANGITPLMSAVRRLHSVTAKALLDVGADPTLVARDDVLPPGVHRFGINTCDRDLLGKTAADMARINVETLQRAATAIPFKLARICALLGVEISTPAVAFECPVCLDSRTTAQEAFTTPCAHTLCMACATSLSTAFCPLCRTSLPELPKATVFAQSMTRRVPFSVSLHTTTVSELAEIINGSRGIGISVHPFRVGAVRLIINGWKNLLEHAASKTLYDAGVRHDMNLVWFVPLR